MVSSNSSGNIPLKTLLFSDVSITRGGYKVYDKISTNLMEHGDPTTCTPKAIWTKKHGVHLKL